MKTVLHYSVPGLPSYQARTVDVDDARRLAQRVAAQTLTHAAILVHSTEDGAEAVELEEVVAPPKLG